MISPFRGEGKELGGVTLYIESLVLRPEPSPFLKFDPIVGQTRYGVLEDQNKDERGKYPEIENLMKGVEWQVVVKLVVVKFIIVVLLSLNS